jgi:CO/xanthine dehydrogenase Mo-binding subunit
MHNSRMLAVLDKAAAMMHWPQTHRTGYGLGMAIHDGFGSFVCQVAEVVLQANQPVVKRICCVVDCGTVVNPAIITAQIEGGIVFGLTAAIKSQITINKGRVQQSNFHDFNLLRQHEMPQVDVYIMPSEQPPGGVGEIGVPPVAPAVANAIFAASGKRHRTLPFS